MAKTPQWAEYWTADAVAECLPYFPDDREKRDRLYVKLWDILAKCKNQTPRGGDGSDGTVEYPDGQYDLDNDDKARHWWHMLTDEESSELNSAYRREYHN